MLPNRPMVGGYHENVGINGRILTFTLTEDCQKIILEKITFTSADGDEGPRQSRKLELTMHHVANIGQNIESCNEGMDSLKNNEKIFGLIPLGDDIYILFDPSEMKQAPYTMTFRMLYPKSDGSKYADGSARLLKSCSGVNCYWEEGARLLVLFMEALPKMQPPQEKEVKRLSIKRKPATRQIVDVDSSEDSDDNVTPKKKTRVIRRNK